MNQWQSLSPDLDRFIMLLMGLRIIRLPLIFRNFEARYLSKSSFIRYIRYGFYINFAQTF